MAEYIKKKDIKYEMWAVGSLNGPLMVVRKKTIDNLPAADVEERVRCEDCVSSGGDRFGELICQNQFCPCYGREVDHAFSCILGERRATT